MKMTASYQNEEKTNNDVKFVTCPFCHGSGQLKENVELPQIEVNKSPMASGVKQPISLYQRDANTSPTTIKLPSIKSLNNSRQTSVDGSNSEDCAMKIKKIRNAKPRSAHCSGEQINEKGDFVQLLPPPMTLRNPVEAIKFAMNQLVHENWEIVMQALSSLVQVSRTNPLLLEPHMTKINQTLCNLLHTMRSHVARYACQCCKELFRTMQSTTRPEFDEIVHSLLQRTADMNKFIRHDANEALDAMVMYIPPISSMRALVEKGPHNKNALVRATVARLLLCTVTMIEVQNLFTLPVYKETRKRIFDTAALLMNDPNVTTRNLIKQLFQLFLKDDNFEMLFEAEANRKLVKKIDKALVYLKYKPAKK